MNRRAFVSTTLLATGRVLGANDRIRIGLIGTGGRCMGLASSLHQMPQAEIVLACDVYEPRRLAASEKFSARAEPEWRRVLDSKEVDAVVIGAPDHWHAPMVTAAVAAGKDVYCEKPVTHDASEGDKLIAAVERSGRIVATGTQQRSWDHFILAKEMVDAGRLGQVTLAQCYWCQNYRLDRRPSGANRIDPAKLDWKTWLGSAREQPFDETRYRRWRFFWDFGGGAFTDLMTHWIDVIQWYLKSPAPQSVMAHGTTHAVKSLECPDTVNASMIFPQNYTAVYYGTMTCSLEDGGIVLRGTEAMMKLNREGFAIYREDAKRPSSAGLPEPEVVVRSTGDGTRTNLENWLACVRDRKQPNANIRAGVEAARTSHLANQAMRAGRALSFS